MSLNDHIAEFSTLLDVKTKAQLTPGVTWAIVQDVDWGAKTMTATGLADELPYYNVQLGLGSFYRKPVVGTKVLLGVPELQGADTFLIECEAYEEAIYVSGDSTFVIKESGFEVKQGDESLRTILLDFMTEVNKIVVVNGTTINQAAVAAIKERLKQVLK